jgi:hypothetical protein
MELGGIIVSAAILVLGIVVAGRFLLRSQARKVASDAAKQVFPVWAIQGPFDSGTESAAAMRNAWLAVFGAEQAAKMSAAIEQHRIAYDNDPKAWEKTRREAAEDADPNACTLAKGIAAAEHLNKRILEEGGHRLEFTKLPDGSTQCICKKIWSEEEIAEKKERDGEAIVLGIGNGLLSDSSPEARKLVEFLSDVYLANTGEKPDASAIGRTWLAFFEMRNEDPDSPLAQEFQRLNDAHSATIPPELEWSENPGCFERHLKRKQNNPLFLEPDRKVTQEQIDEARERDREDAAKLQKELVDLASDLQNLPELATPGEVAPIRERIDELLDRAAGIGGQADHTRDALNELRNTLIDDLREGMTYNGEILRQLEEIERHNKLLVEIFHTAFIAQMGRIPSSDLIPAMLSEAPETIRKVMSIIGEDKVALVFKDACDRVKRAQAEGEVIPLADEKLKAIKGG